jgi:hypothetical protein
LLLRANCYVNFELNLTESVVVLLPTVALPGAGVDNGVVMLPVITLDNKSVTVVYESGLFDNFAASKTPLGLIIRVLLLILVQVVIKQFQTIK